MGISRTLFMTLSEIYDGNVFLSCQLSGLISPKPSGLRERFVAPNECALQPSDWILIARKIDSRHVTSHYYD